MPADSLIIQSARGLHAQLLEKTHTHHDVYCRRHGVDYLAYFGAAEPTRSPKWDRTCLLRKALSSRDPGSLVIWMDADTVVMDLEADPREMLPEGKLMGMVEYPKGFHMGVLALRVDKKVSALFDRVWEGYPVPGEGEDRDALVSALGVKPPSWFYSMDPKWNSTVKVNEVEGPVIRAWHGQGTVVSRLKALEQILG